MWPSVRFFTNVVALARNQPRCMLRLCKRIALHACLGNQPRCTTWSTYVRILLYIRRSNAYVCACMLDHQIYSLHSLANAMQILWKIKAHHAFLSFFLKTIVIGPSNLIKMPLFVNCVLHACDDGAGLRSGRTKHIDWSCLHKKRGLDGTAATP
jgi:hypothetical protein